MNEVVETINNEYELTELLNTIGGDVKTIYLFTKRNGYYNKEKLIPGKFFRNNNSIICYTHPFIATLELYAKYDIPDRSNYVLWKAEGTGSKFVTKYKKECAVIYENIRLVELIDIPKIHLINGIKLILNIILSITNEVEHKIYRDEINNYLKLIDDVNTDRTPIFTNELDQFVKMFIFRNYISKRLGSSSTGPMSDESCIKVMSGKEWDLRPHDHIPLHGLISIDTIVMFTRYISELNYNEIINFKYELEQL